MKVVIWFVVGAIALLSIAAGGAKIALVPEEVAFLGQYGFSEIHVQIFGVIQVIGGILLAVPATRIGGGVLVALAFAASSVLIFLDGAIGFAAASLIPVLLTCLVVYWPARKKGT